jgi:hypothetical protein
VVNNPVNANDPSGHRCNGEPEECLDNDGDPINGADWSYVGDLSTSSDPSRPSSIDPAASDAVLSLYNIYRQMWLDRGGWWWDEYESGGFTIWEFMAVMWGYEQQGFPNTQNYATALGNRGDWWCGVMGCDIHTAEGAMQFMMGFSQVIPGRVKNLILNPELFDTHFYPPAQWWQDDQMLIVQSISSGASTSGPNALFDVGNVSMRTDIFRKMSKLGMMHTVWGQPGEDKMIILTYCQWQVMNYALSNDETQSINMRVYRSFCRG